MNVFRLKTFDETWALLRQRLACVFDEALCDDVDPELPSKTETYNIVRDCCFIERWQEQLYAVCVPELQALGEAWAGRVAAAAAAAAGGDALLVAVASAWAFWSKQLYLCVGLLQYLEQDHCARHKHLGVVSLWRVGVEAARDGLARRPGLVEAVEDACADRCARARAAAEADAAADPAAAACGACCRALSAMGRYERDDGAAAAPRLEDRLLRDAADFYAAEGARLARRGGGDGGADARAFVAAAERALRRASDAADADRGTVAPETGPKLVAVVERELVAPHAAGVVARGLAPLLDAAVGPEGPGAAAALFGLLRRGGDVGAAKRALASHAAARFGECVAAPGDALGAVLDLRSRLEAAAGAAFAVEEEEPDYAPGDPWADVLEGIEALDAMKALRRREREERDWAGRAVRGACEEAVNGDAVAARFARAVAAALDGELRSGGAGGPRFEGALACFRLSRAKDAFEGRHRGLAATRLLDGVFGGGADLARALAAERALVATLEAECGASYVAKLEGMCKDAAAAAGGAAGPGAAAAGAGDLEVLVLTAGYWPPAPPCALAPPPALAEMERAFEASYVAERKGRRLAWRPDLGRADVAADYGGARATLDATLAQALLLVALDGGAALSAGAAAAAAGLDPGDAARALASLAAANVVAADGGGAYAANAAFPGRGRVRLPAPAAPSGADGGAGDVEAKAAREDRQYAVDATIVRVMKARKTLSHAALLGDVFAQLKRPASTADVKARVESLIEREYLERDPRDAGVYNYLA